MPPVICPCCHQPMLVRPQVFPKRTLHQIDCTNPACALHMKTGTLEAGLDTLMQRWNVSPGDCAILPVEAG